MTEFRPANKLERYAKPSPRGIGVLKSHAICPLSEDGVCSLSRGREGGLIMCTSDIPETCGIYRSWRLEQEEVKSV